VQTCALPIYLRNSIIMEDPDLNSDELQICNILENETELEGIITDATQAAHNVLLTHMQKVVEDSSNGDGNGKTETTTTLPKHWKQLKEYNFSTCERQIEKMKEFGEAVLGYTPHRWQLEAAMVVHDGEDVMVIVVGIVWTWYTSFLVFLFTFPFLSWSYFMDDRTIGFLAYFPFLLV